jgi:hypothetical protein
MTATRRLAAILAANDAKVRFPREASTATLIGKACCPPRLCENAQEPTRRRIVFSIALLPTAATALFVSTLTKSRRTFYAQIECVCFHTACTQLSRSRRESERQVWGCSRSKLSPGPCRNRRHHYPIHQRPPQEFLPQEQPVRLGGLFGPVKSGQVHRRRPAASPPAEQGVSLQRRCDLKQLPKLPVLLIVILCPAASTSRHHQQRPSRRSRPVHLARHRPRRATARLWSSRWSISAPPF